MFLPCRNLFRSCQAPRVKLDGNASPHPTRRPWGWSHPLDSVPSTSSLSRLPSASRVLGPPPERSGVATVVRSLHFSVLETGFLKFCSCVTLGKLLTSSQPSFLICKADTNAPFLKMMASTGETLRTVPGSINDSDVPGAGH